MQRSHVVSTEGFRERWVIYWNVVIEVTCSSHEDRACITGWVWNIKRKQLRILFVWNADCNCLVQVHRVLLEQWEPQASLVGVDFVDPAALQDRLELPDPEVQQDLQELQEAYEDHLVVQAAQVCVRATVYNTEMIYCRPLLAKNHLMSPYLWKLG